MDPDAVLNTMIEALVECDREQVTQSLTDLLNWVEMGGFLPSHDNIRIPGASILVAKPRVRKI